MPFQKRYFAMKENSFPFLLLCSPSYRPQAVKNVKRLHLQSETANTKLAYNWKHAFKHNVLLGNLRSWHSCEFVSPSSEYSLIRRAQCAKITAGPRPACCWLVASVIWSILCCVKAAQVENVTFLYHGSAVLPALFRFFTAKKDHDERYSLSPAALVAERFRGINYAKLTEVNYTESINRWYIK